MPKSEELFHQIVQSRPLTHTRKMFGGIGGFVKEIMFAIYDSSGNIYLRFDETDRSELIKIEGAGTFGNMREYIRVPESVLEDEWALDEWIEKSFKYALTVKPKTRKKRTK